MRRSTMMVIVVFCMLAVATGSICMAQPTQSEAAFILPWQHLNASKTPRTYQSILKSTGTVHIAGSESATSNDPTYILHLPFDVQFLGAVYPAGSDVHVGINGFLSFDPAAATGIWPYLLAPDSGYSRVLMPFWTDLMTSGGADQGIFHRYEINVDGDSIWTIEWNVQTMSAPFCSGRFQLKLTKKATWAACYAPITMFEFLYDSTHPINRGAPGKFGAQIGIKNTGQDIGTPAALNFGVDDNKYLLFAPTGATTPYTPAITRLPTRRQGALDSVPDYYACATTPLSGFFHYGTPDSNCRMTPVEADVSAVRKGEPGFGDGIVYARGSHSTTHIHIANLGTGTVDQVPIHVTITRSGAIHRDTLVADTVRSWDTTVVTITLLTDSAGEYRVTAAATVPNDEDRTNDTASWSYFVSPTTDAMATAIVSPVLEDPRTTPRYVTGGSIPIDGIFTISGSGTVSAVYGGYQIRSAAGSLVAQGRDTTSGSGLRPGTDYPHHFGRFIPQAPGLYYIRVYFSAVGDQLTRDDTLLSIPHRDWISHGPGQNVRGVRPVPFEVFAPFEMAAADPGFYPQLPFMDDTINGTTRVMEVYLNNGGSSSARVARATIVGPDNRVVYSQTIRLPRVNGGRRMRMQYFPNFTPTASGMYRVITWLDRDSADANWSNDTASWRFWVRLDTDGRSGRDNAGGLSSIDRLEIPRTTPAISATRGEMFLDDERRRGAHRTGRSDGGRDLFH